MDVQSFGLTGPREDEDYTIDSYVRFMDQFIQAMGIDSFHLAGNSLGGKIAWQYAINNQDKIGKLVLIAPTGFYTDDKESSLVFELGKNKTMAALIRNLGTSFFVKNTLADVYYDDDKIPEHLHDLYLAASKRAGNRAAFLKRVGLEEKDTQTDKLSTINTPTLLMWGDHDVLVPHHLAKQFQERLPNDTLIVYPNVGHVPMEEIPAQSVEDAMRFLR
jgi:pimeloyl-ACP methyl ester carboxylesterase